MPPLPTAILAGTLDEDGNPTKPDESTRADDLAQLLEEADTPMLNTVVETFELDVLPYNEKETEDFGTEAIEQDDL